MSFDTFLVWELLLTFLKCSLPSLLLILSVNESDQIIYLECRSTFSVLITRYFCLHNFLLIIVASLRMPFLT